ncbi:MAG: glycosyltransferase family 2 protein [Candidatus Magasanikbacteria bacterium]|jgi:GT2 family glycosyltransferase|nr:glycosyltransferase family 2 protein [Candidatus Magasanikbacteria bacterium]MBT4071493.1 glycosyltransferase family 2 protein [Candidatus Magasanikbacteria bacterium]
MKQYPKIAIVYLMFYHNESYIDNVVSALKRLTYPKDKVEFIVVSNPHPEDGSFVHYIEDAVMPLSGKEIPHTTIIANKENIGFGRGNNVGADWAIEHDFDYVFYHNNDGFFAANALEPLLEALEKDKTIGMAQSLMLLHPETELVNSTGNAFHYLGFGYSNDYRLKIADIDLPAVKEIDYASGAALLVRTELIKKHGGWDLDFFMYHEDLEWAMRLRTLGYKIVLVRDSVFYHQYQFSRSIMKFFWMERNRWAVMLMYLKCPTWLLLLPILIPLEMGLWYFSWKNGYLSKRLEVYKYWMKKENRAIWLKKRKKIQKERIVNDRFLFDHSVTGIYFQDESVTSPLVKYIANPVMKVYYAIIVRGLLWW